MQLKELIPGIDKFKLGKSKRKIYTYAYWNLHIPTGEGRMGREFTGPPEHRCIIEDSKGVKYALNGDTEVIKL